jgi:hypothetical protein
VLTTIAVELAVSHRMFPAAAEPKPNLSGRIFLVYAEAPSPLSILYAGIVMLEGDRRNFSKEFVMISHVTSQVMALSKGKQKPRAKAQRDAATNATSQVRSRNRKHFLSRVFGALVETRMRRAEMKVEHHRRFYVGHTR